MKEDVPETDTSSSFFRCERRINQMPLIAAITQRLF